MIISWLPKFDYGIRLPLIKKSLFVFDKPLRGEIVVFMRPDDPSTLTDESSINIIKRVVGLPGEKLEVKNGQVYINDQELEEGLCCLG